MNETESQNLADRLDLHQAILVELCRKCFIGDEFDRLFASLSKATTSETLRKFEKELMMPIMGRDKIE